jgi:DNA-binding response OmpR family regulator
LGNHRQWHGRKILVVEDNFLLAEMVSNCLRDWGMEAIGPASRLREVCQLARERALDGALVDVKLGESLCSPVCTILKTRNIPFVFMTGYEDLSMIPLEFRAAPVVWKPFRDDELKAAVALIVPGYEEQRSSSRPNSA